MERYQPTSDDKQRLRMKEGMLKVSGDQVFATLQGEGVTAGRPAVFLRLHFCNLACGKNGGWKCDTGYTWDPDRAEFWQEPIDWSLPESVSRIEDAWNDKFGLPLDIAKRRLVITGGEPLLQQGMIVELLKSLPDWDVEIETNGTIKPSPELSNCQINCSPKLSNSGNSKFRRFKAEILRAINDMPNSWFKFVVTNQQDLNEVQELIDICQLNPKKILIMPEGYTIEALEKHLSAVRSEVKIRGWNITKRNQIEWYGSKRRT